MYMEGNVSQSPAIDEIVALGTVDVVIPTYQPDEKFEQLLVRLHKQTVKPRHIYIINTEENFFRSEEAKKYEDITITHISKYEFDHGGTRNQGASMSDADFILFITQDAVPKNKHLVEKLLGAFQDEQVAAAYARQLGDAKKDYMEHYTRVFNYPPESRKKTIEDLNELGIKTFFCSNVCAMYRRSLFEDVGGFACHAIFNEDMMMAAELVQGGYAIYYAADAKVTHWHSYTGLQQLKRNFDVAVSQQQAGELFTKVKSEKEGIRLVVRTCGHMLKHGKFYLIPKVIWISGFKFIGFQLGKRYRKLPKSWIRKLSLNPDFWTSYWDRQMAAL